MSFKEVRGATVGTVARVALSLTLESRLDPTGG